MTPVTAIRRALTRLWRRREPRNPRRPTLCGRVDRVWTVEGKELAFWCSEPYEHLGRHRAVNVDGVELTWNRSDARDHDLPQPPDSRPDALWRSGRP